MDVKKRCAIAFEIGNALFPELLKHDEVAFKSACEGIAVLKQSSLKAMHERSIIVARTTHFINASAHDFYRLEQKYEVEKSDMRKEYADSDSKSLSEYPEKNVPQENPTKDVASEAPFYISEETEAPRKELNALTPDLKDISDKVYPEKNIPQEHPKKASVEVEAGQNGIMQHSTDKVVNNGDVAIYSKDAEEDNPNYSGLEKDQQLKADESGKDDLSGQYLKKELYNKKATMEEYPEEEEAEAPEAELETPEEVEVESSFDNYGVSFNVAEEEVGENLEAENELKALFGDEFGGDKVEPMTTEAKKTAKLSKIPNAMLNMTASSNKGSNVTDLECLFGK